jgi:hypothetical protein
MRALALQKGVIVGCAGLGQLASRMVTGLRAASSGLTALFARQYECGKVCLSLLNTWAGRNSEVWDASCSTLLQVRPLAPPAVEAPGALAILP